MRKARRVAVLAAAAWALAAQHANAAPTIGGGEEREAAYRAQLDGHLEARAAWITPSRRPGGR